MQNIVLAVTQLQIVQLSRHFV